MDGVPQCTNKKIIWHAVILCIVAVVFVIPAVALSQSSQSVNVEITPSQPKPNEQVFIKVNSTQLDLDRSNFVWSVNNEERLRGIGERRVQLTTGKAGSVTNIRVVIQTPQGSTVIRNITLRPAEVDILWEGFSYTPPFYKGKSLNPSGGIIILTAIPNVIDQNGNILQPKDLVFTWSNLGVTLGESSGIGKNQIVMNNGTSALDPLRVTVEAKTFNGEIVAEKTITVPLARPNIIAYEKHPLEGIRYEKALLGSMSINQEEVALRAEPFFFSLDDFINGNLLYRWKVNNRDVNIPLNEQTNEIVLRLEENKSGQARVSLEIENNNLPLRVFQEAQIHLEVNLNQ